MHALTPNFCKLHLPARPETFFTSGMLAAPAAHSSLPALQGPATTSGMLTNAGPSDACCTFRAFLLCRPSISSTSGMRIAGCPRGGCCTSRRHPCAPHCFPSGSLRQPCASTSKAGLSPWLRECLYSPCPTAFACLPDPAADALRSSSSGCRAEPRSPSARASAVGVHSEQNALMQSKMLPHFARCRQHCGRIRQRQDAMIMCARGSRSS